MPTSGSFGLSGHVVPWDVWAVGGLEAFVARFGRRKRTRECRPVGLSHDRRGPNEEALSLSQTHKKTRPHLATGSCQQLKRQTSLSARPAGPCGSKGNQPQPEECQSSGLRSCEFPLNEAVGHAIEIRPGIHVESFIDTQRCGSEAKLN